jgi:hypothetical protein
MLGRKTQHQRNAAVLRQFSFVCVTRHEERVCGKGFFFLRWRLSVEQKVYLSVFIVFLHYAADERINSVQAIRQVILTKVRGKRERQVEHLFLADRMPEIEVHVFVGGVFTRCQFVKGRSVGVASLYEHR